MDVIRLIPLAIEQGSKNAKKLYMTYLVNSVLGIKAGEHDGLSYGYIRAIEFLEHAIEGVISVECDKKGTEEIYKVVKTKCLIARYLCFLPPLLDNLEVINENRILPPL